MLQFIFGKPSSGKTYTIINKIKELSDSGQESVLIVPEQFTFESEREILRTVGDNFALNTTVLSFSRLYEEIGRNVGGISAKILTNSEKIILMHKALCNSRDNLKLWKKYTNSITFAKTILDTIGEFKINSVDSNDILKVAKTVESETLKLKLFDIATILQEYNICVGEKFLDPADTLDKLYNTLINYNFFKGKTVFIDSFKGFTGQQFKIIERILSQSKDVFISFCYNPKNTKEFGIYTNIRKNINKISKIATSHFVKISEPIILSESHYNSSSLEVVEKVMSGEEYNTLKIINDVSIFKCETAFDEAEIVSTIIKKLVREENYRFKDFVIIARDIENYKEPISTACKKNNISLYYDNRFPLSAFPLSVFVLSAIKACDFSTENILKMQKTGLATLEYSEISKLENYTYLWNITGDSWLKEWEMSPKGFTTEQDKNEDLEELNLINSLRIKAIGPLIKFKKSFNNDAIFMTKAILKLLKDCDVSAKLINLSEKFESKNEIINIDILSQCYDLFMNVLDSVVLGYAQEKITQNEYFEALKTAISLSDVGTVPQMLDEVTFGSADRIRPSRPKIAFILGANQGVFPKIVSNSGIFNIGERKKLIECDINIDDNSIYSSINEEFLAYSNLCCARDKLFITYSSSSLTGEGLEPSTFVSKISSSLNINVIDFTDFEILNTLLPETKQKAFSDYCKNFKTKKTISETYKYALSGTEYYDRILKIESDIFGDKLSIEKETAKKLYGTNIAMSATKFDTFSRCKFSFFCRYGLKAKRLQPADFDVMQRGTIVHYCLEKFINENKNNFSKLDEEQLVDLTQQYINSYLDMVKGFSNIKTKRVEFLISRISRSLKDVIKHIAKELSQSDFKPVSCELKIGIKEDEINVKFPFDEGNINLFGSIDRLDKYDGYIRIIDYKTGSKSFKLPDILFGLNMQMLIYLYAVTRGSGLNDTSAAGILYQPSKRDIKGEGLAMNGLLQSDINLINAMDKNGEGEFVPKLSLNKDGSISKRANSFIEKEEFSEIFNLIEKLMTETGNKIIYGDISVDPIDGRESTACGYCDFRSVCKIENKIAKSVPNLSNSQVFEFMKAGEDSAV